MPAARNRIAVAAVAAIVLAAAGARAAEPRNSWSRLVSSNGFCAVVYDAASRRADGFLEHVYRYPTRDVGRTGTRDLCWDTYFGVRVGGDAAWLTDVPLDDVGYLPGTGVIRTRQTYQGLRIETFWFAPWDAPGPVLAMVASVENAGAGPSPPVSLFTIHNFHLGGGRPEPGADGERIVWNPADRSYAETGAGGGVAVYRPVEPPDRRACTPNNPYPAVRAGADLVDTADSGPTDDAVAGFQFDLGTLGPGESRTRGVLVGFHAGGDAAAARALLAPLVAAGDSGRILSDERARWASRIADAPPPSGLSAAEEALWLQSAAVLLSGQVREPGRSHGQIVASLPPGQWNISWVRDMCYAIVGLAKAGLFEQARDALRFMLGAEVGEYESYVGRPYRISVTRYFGDGTEESDWNEDGPNIEFDGFGLFLWALGELAEAWDDGWWRDHWPVVRDEIADVLVSLRDPATGLIAPDSSIWEVHWNGNQKRFTYTSLAAARGLCSASMLAERLGDSTLAASYRDAAIGIRDAVLARSTDDRGALAQSWEDLRAGRGYRDAAVVEAINWGLVRPDGRVSNATLDMLITDLVPPSGRGFFRNDDGGWYDNQEWVFVDLRAADAFRAAGRSAVADDLLTWITAQGTLNYGLIAELHDRVSGDYRGEVPMVGFGAGAYIVALAERSAGTAAMPACGEWPVETPDVPDAGDGGDDATDAGDPARPAAGGCACRLGGVGRGSGVVGAAILAVLGLRRRGR